MPSSLLGKSVPIEGGGGLCGLSISCPSPQDTRRQRHRKQNDPKCITIPSNQTKFVLSRCVSLSVGSWSCTSFPPSLNGQRVRSYCPTKVTNSNKYWFASNAVACACSAAPRCLRFSYLELSGTNCRSTPRLSLRQLASGCIVALVGALAMMAPGRNDTFADERRH